MSNAFRCADSSQSRSEPLFATASHVPNWLLLEQPGGWGHDASIQSKLDPDIGRAVVDKARAESVRVVFIKRGTRLAGLQRQAFLCHVAPEGGWLERVAIQGPEDLLSVDLSAVRTGRAGQGERVNDPIYLVCTHGRHDACCSIRGNPVSRALCDALPGRAWEVSHIGGDRFAANIVSLPNGVYYGRVEVSDAVEFVTDLDDGRLNLDHYRGRCCYSFPVQAAEFFVRREMNLVQVAALTLSRAVRVDGGTLWATFDVSGREVTARVRIASDANAYLLTCKSDKKQRSLRFELLSLAAG